MLFEAKFIVDWVDDTKFIVSKNETGITGNLYFGLMHYEDMSFLLHYLKPEDTFYDIGANVGAYTILASGVAKAKTIAFEPLPATYNKLIDQIRINKIDNLVEAKNKGVGSEIGSLEFTNDLNCMNRVNTDPFNNNVNLVEVITLDKFYLPNSTSVVKIDVEGFEKFVLQGGEKFFSNENVSVLIIELNGSGAAFGVKDSDVHHMIISFGFRAVSYDPFVRNILPIENYGRSGNTIYVKSLKEAQCRVNLSSNFCIHTANKIVI